MDIFRIMMFLKEFFKTNFQVINMKTLYFHVNLLTYKLLLQVINKIEAKIHVNNLKSTVKFTLKCQLQRKKIIIGHICYSIIFFAPSTPYTTFCLNKNMPNYNRVHINCYLKAICNILLNKEFLLMVVFIKTFSEYKPNTTLTLTQITVPKMVVEFVKHLFVLHILHFIFLFQMRFKTFALISNNFEFQININIKLRVII